MLLFCVCRPPSNPRIASVTAVNGDLVVRLACDTGVLGEALGSDG